MEVSTRNQRTEEWSNPVYPVVRLERGACYAGAERSRRVETGPGVEYAGDFGDEEGEADADGGDERVFGLLGGEDKDCDYELRR